MNGGIVIVAHRKVTRDMLARADTIFAVAADSPLEERPIFISRELESEDLLNRTARVLLVLLEPDDVQRQVMLRRFRIAKAKSRSEGNANGVSSDHVLIDSVLEWRSAEPETIPK